MFAVINRHILTTTGGRGGTVGPACGVLCCVVKCPSKDDFKKLQAKIPSQRCIHCHAVMEPSTAGGKGRDEQQV